MTDIAVQVEQALVLETKVTPVVVELRVQGGVAGPQGIPGTSVTGSSFVHTQGVATTLWTIDHNMGFYPNVTIVDSSGEQVEGDVDYINANTVTVTFAAAFSGVAYLS